MNITKAHYDFYCAKKIKCLGNYKAPKGKGLINSLIPGKTTHTDNFKHRTFNLLKLSRKLKMGKLDNKCLFDIINYYIGSPDSTKERITILRRLRSNYLKSINRQKD